MSRPRVVVVGAGMAGLTAAHLLRERCDVTVLDKGRGVGGRLATRRIGDATFDHGAQFITTHSAEFAATVDRWVTDGVVAPWFRGRIGPEGALDPDGHTRFRGSTSMNAVAKNLAVGLDVRTSSQVSALAHDSESWKVTLVDGSELFADVVLATAPVPQTLALLENGDVVLTSNDVAALNAIAYDPCIALMAALDGPSGLSEPGAVDPVDGPIDWMADNQLKGISPVPAVTIHATPDFSRAQWDASDEAITEALLTAARLDAAVVAGSVQIQRWRYARPSVEHPERFLRLSDMAPFVFAGDAFGGAKVEGAALSGAAAAREIESTLGRNA
ncbi:MAG: FAD-dependent oxidoreductase [Actinomycetota bacterium]